MKFSLIISTRGRTAEIVRVFESFRDQTLQDFEVIVSDQNGDDRLVEVLAKIAWPGPLTHIRSKGGVSAGRNAAIDLARGELIAFPDDDCKFPPTLLADVADFFARHPEYGCISGRSVADNGEDAASKHSKEAGRITRFKIYQQCIEFAMFVRRDALGDLRFDENLGSGSPSQCHSDEGPDMILNLEARGINSYYEPKFAIWHPRVEIIYKKEVLNNRSYYYALGSGYFMRKQNYPFWFFAKMNLRTLGGVVLGLVTFQWAKAQYYWARFRGRWHGWTGYPVAQAGGKWRHFGLIR